MKRINYFIILFSIAVSAHAAGLTNAVYWDFGAAGSGGSLAPSQNPWSDLTVGNWGVGNVFHSNPTLAPNSTSSGYTTAAGFAASGATNAEAAIEAGTSINTSSSTYFSTSLTLDITSPIYLTIMDVSFGSRSTATGPTNLALYVSTDGFASDFEQLGTTTTVVANSAYAAIDFSDLSFEIDPGETLSLRLYGVGKGGSTSANWRVDDFAIVMTPAAIPAPEPSEMVLATLSGLIGWVVLRRKF